MPLYEYQCGRCGRFEVIRKFSDPPLEACPTCGEEIQKLPSSPAIQFKGTGWYVTDYARKSEGGGDKGNGTKTETKTDTKTDTAKEGAASSKSSESTASSPKTSTSNDSSASGSSSTK